MAQRWERRAGFVNGLLAMAVAYGDIDHAEILYDGIAGDMFDKAIEATRTDGDEQQIDHYIELALMHDVPVSGLEADGTFGKKWNEVVALAKASD